MMWNDLSVNRVEYNVENIAEKFADIYLLVKKSNENKNKDWNTYMEKIFSFWNESDHYVNCFPKKLLMNN